jgi:hypothetical protein
MEHEIEMQLNKKIGEFVAAMTDGINSWVKAGEIVVEILAIDPDGVDKICEAIPGLPKDVIYKFESLGRREIRPELLISDAPGVKMLAALPYSVQEKYISSPIPVLVASDGAVTTLNVSIQSLTPNQCKQVFAKHHVKDLGEQRAYIEDQRRREKAQKEEIDVMPYTISGGKVTFRTGCILNLKELKQLIKVMEK